MKHLSAFDKYREKLKMSKMRLTGNKVEDAFDIVTSFFDAGDLAHLQEKILRLNKFLKINLSIPANDAEQTIFLKNIENDTELGTLFKNLKDTSLNDMKKALEEINQKYLLQINQKLQKPNDLGIFDKN